MGVAAGWVLVLGETCELARRWCDLAGIHRRRRCVLNSTRVRGFTLRRGDRVVFVGHVEARPDYEHIVAALLPALGELSVSDIERVSV